MSSLLGCCFWWFLLGALLGWLANWLLCKSCCKPKQNITQVPAPSSPPSAPPPAAKLADVPATSAAVASAPVAASKPKAPAKAPVKPKAAPKAKTETKAKAPAKPKAAKKAVVASTINLAAAKAAGFAIKNADDLTIIEGIGPKINDLFKDAGLKTFAQVAKATVPEMRAILDKGGSRFRIANPGTWAQQAALANDNKWTELKKLQDELSAGIQK